MAGGFMGKIMFVNLKTQTWKVEHLDEKFYRDYIGGYGLGARILYERIKPGIDPLGPENIFGVIAGMFVGTKVHAAGRFNVVAKSPLTGGWGDAGCGGKFGPKLKATGYDAIFFEDVSDKPVYVSINNDEVTFHDASHLWGKDSCDTETAVRAELGKQYGVITIGQAGENLSKIAGVFNEQGRAAARMGIGAVMGSKKLKAVACTGTCKPEIANPELFQEVFNIMKADQTYTTPPPYNQFGTTMVYVNNVSIHDAPIQNWKYTRKDRYSLEQAEKLGFTAYQKYHKKKYACAQCAVGCGAVLEVDSPDGNGKYETHRPEYETIGCFGSLLLMDNLEDLLEANELCNRYGMDTICVGGTIAWLLEVAENGLLTEEEKEGLDLTWGNSKILKPLIEKMAFRQGFLGELLADSSKIASEKLGRGSEAFRADTGGVEPPMHDPRCWPGFGYGYALDPTPGHHCQGTVGFMEHGWSDKELYAKYDYSYLTAEKYQFDKDKGMPMKNLNDWFHCFNSTGMCILAKYAGYPNFPIVNTFRAVTGWDDFSVDEALATGERINTLRHMFNVREGIHMAKDFCLKDRLRGEPPLDNGPTAGITIPMDKITQDYYTAMDWDIETEMPSDAALEKLGIKDFVMEHLK